MIEDGDRIAVCVSGGKDSVVMLLCLINLKIFYPKKFELYAVTLDPQFHGECADYSETVELWNMGVTDGEKEKLIETAYVVCEDLKSFERSLRVSVFGTVSPFSQRLTA